MSGADHSSPRDQDYVFKDGRFIGDFEGLYRHHADPWHQSQDEQVQDTRRTIVRQWCTRLRDRHPGLVNRVVEMGCGYGQLTAALARDQFSAIGVDVSSEAIRKARDRNDTGVFLVHDIRSAQMLHDLDPDVLIMAEVTWYVLDHLEDVKERLRSFAKARSRPTFLIHLLTTYAPGIQKYGLDYFSDLDSILNWWGLDYLEAGFILSPRTEDPLAQGTYFVAQLS